jgi:hypothetical protein
MVDGAPSIETPDDTTIDVPPVEAVRRLRLPDDPRHRGAGPPGEGHQAPSTPSTPLPPARSSSAPTTSASRPPSSATPTGRRPRTRSAPRRSTRSTTSVITDPDAATSALRAGTIDLEPTAACSPRVPGRRSWRRPEAEGLRGRPDHRASPATSPSLQSVAPLTNIHCRERDLLRVQQVGPAARLRGGETVVTSPTRWPRRTSPATTRPPTRSRTAPTTPVTSTRPRTSSPSAVSRTASPSHGVRQRRCQGPQLFEAVQARPGPRRHQGEVHGRDRRQRRRTTRRGSARRRTSSPRTSASRSPVGVLTSRRLTASGSRSPTATRSSTRVTPTTRA